MGEIQNVLPDSDGNTTFTPLSGSTRWQAVSDASDANYIYRQDSNAGQRLGIADFTFSESAVIGLTINVRHQKTSGSASPNTQARIRVNGTDYNGATLTPPTAPSWQDDQEVWLTNPSTASAWTKDQLNEVAVSDNLDFIVMRANSMASGDEVRYSQVSADGEYNPLLIVDDITCAVSMDNVDMTSKHSLLVDDISCSVSMDNIDMTSKHALLVDSMESAVSMDNVGFRQTLEVDNNTCSVSMDNIYLLYGTGKTELEFAVSQPTITAAVQ